MGRLSEVSAEIEGLASPGVAEQMPALSDFERMVDNHDLTYSYADDGDSWRRGQAQFDAIIKAARTLPIDDVKRIWKAKCDKCLIADAAPQFYWQDRWLTAKAGA